MRGARLVSELIREVFIVSVDDTMTATVGDDRQPYDLIDTKPREAGRVRLRATLTRADYEYVTAVTKRSRRTRSYVLRDMIDHYRRKGW